MGVPFFVNASCKRLGIELDILDQVTVFFRDFIHGDGGDQSGACMTLNGIKQVFSLAALCLLLVLATTQLVVAAPADFKTQKRYFPNQGIL